MDRCPRRTARAAWTRAAGLALLAAALAADARAADDATGSGPRAPAPRPLAAHLAVAADTSGDAAGPQDAGTDPDAPADSGVMDFFRQIEVSGLVDGYYLWAFNETGPQLHAFDVHHNSFSLNYAELAVGKPVSETSRAGFRLEFGAGDTAGLVNSFEPGGADYLKHVQQAYVSYLVPAGRGLTVDFGKFVTPHGAELIESHANPNYSRGLLFTLAIPFYHTGLRTSYPVTDAVTLTGFLVNGWNNVVDNNGDKTGGVSVGVTATDRLFVGVNYMAGKEGGAGDGVRHVLDSVVTYAATDRLSVVGNADYGRDDVGGEDLQWYGVALGLKYQLNDLWSVSPRYEIFMDDDGWATGLGQTLQEVTVTADYEPVPGFLTRLEFRSDFSDEDVFTDRDGGLTSTQPTVSMAFVYSFSK